MTRNIYILFFVFWFALGNSLVAQTNWNLNRCISYAIENNNGLKQTEIQEKLVSEDLNQSKRNLLPGLSASSQAGLNFGRSIDPATNGISNTKFFNNSYAIGASVILFDGFKLLNQMEYQKFRKKTSELNRLNAIDDLAFSVMTSYFNVIYYQGMLQIAQEQVETSTMNLKKTERQVELGMKSKTDLLEMSAHLEAEKLNRIQMENSMKKAMLQLRQQMNLTDEAELVLEAEQSPMVVIAEKQERQDLFSAYTQRSPYYQSYVAQLGASRKALAISRSHLYPSLSASGSVNSGFYETTKDVSGRTMGFSKQLEANRSQYLGASLSIPILSRWAVRSDIKKAKLEMEQASTTLEQEKQKMYFEMANNLNDLESLEKEYNQYKKQQEADQLVFQASEKKFGQGLVSVVDFYIAKNKLATSTSQVLQARLQWEIKKKTLDFYKGEKFWE
ncbi:MAG TPA: TolC family protein [Prolixibacteraceae bacterium]|nr:TolC family protein [Prolixibacteraceae bacterium]